MQNDINEKIQTIIKEKSEKMINKYVEEGYDRKEITDKITFLTENGYALEDIINMNTKYPNLLKFDITRNLFALDYLEEDYGFAKEEITNLIKENPILLLLSERHVMTLLGNAKTSEYSKETYIEMLYNSAIRTDVMLNRISKTVGYKETDALKITDYFSIDADLFKLPHNYPDYFSKMVEKFIEYGYSKEEALKITTMCPKLLELPDNYNGLVQLPNILEAFEKIGYKKEEIVKMTVSKPYIFKINNSDITDVLKYFAKEGYTEEEIKTITIEKPGLFTIMNNIKTVENIFLYENHNLLELLRVLPKNIEKNYNHTYCRFNYLKDNNIPINRNNFKSLFGSDHDFIEKYGVSDKLLSLSYNPYNFTEKIFSYALEPEQLPKKRTR